MLTNVNAVFKIRDIIYRTGNVNVTAEVQENKMNLTEKSEYVK